MPHTDFSECVRRLLGGTATPRAAVLAIDAVTQAMEEGLREDGELRLANFGVLSLRRRAARRILLPGTGEPALLPPRREFFFRPAPATTLPGEQAGLSHDSQTSHLCP